MKTLEEITQALESLQEQAATAVASVEGDSVSATQLEEVKALVEEIKPQVDTLRNERDAAIREEEFKSMRSQVGTLEGVIEELRKPVGPFSLGRVEDLPSDDPYAAGGSVFLDIRLANKGDQDAKQRLLHGVDTSDRQRFTPEGKAMTEGTNSQGGYLVRPQIERQIVESIELDNKLRALCSSISINTNAIQLDQLTLSTTAGWVAELAQKPESTGMTLATITASVFTAAGLVTISNQLLADSDPAVDQLVVTDLVKRLVALEETAFLTGSGSGQPLGILNTPGIGTTTYTDGSPTAAELCDQVLDAIAAVQTAHGEPSAILMHPRTWTSILKAKDTAGAWLINPAGPGDSAITGARTVFRGPEKTLWGVPVITSNRIPTNLGGGTESRVIVGDFKEALILDREGVAIDESSHVYFTTNQTIFRAEKRLGFTAARTPLAFNVIGGTGLAGL